VEDCGTLLLDDLAEEGIGGSITYFYITVLVKSSLCAVNLLFSNLLVSSFGRMLAGIN
jgi:hypothetical protein